ncbi:hypothetical protein SAMN05216226_10689 [Halovenus aranensis]|uniref:Uncharacterized protein n=1 Tax=Halovenus aranensis TaxID=890420 RepID=A0A1G8VAB3_9EURY|nr:hypothetical protein [Halovenus aranensis]SDJ62834.1 hypothetical protein SAMN05216226_10689 [Halovenus aranensis]
MRTLLGGARVAVTTEAGEFDQAGFYFGENPIATVGVGLSSVVSVALRAGAAFSRSAEGAFNHELGDGRHCGPLRFERPSIRSQFGHGVFRCRDARIA